MMWRNGLENLNKMPVSKLIYKTPSGQKYVKSGGQDVYISESEAKEIKGMSYSEVDKAISSGKTGSTPLKKAIERLSVLDPNSTSYELELRNIAKLTGQDYNELRKRLAKEDNTESITPSEQIEQRKEEGIELTPAQKAYEEQSKREKLSTARVDPNLVYLNLQGQQVKINRMEGESSASFERRVEATAQTVGEQRQTLEAKRTLQGGFEVRDVENQQSRVSNVLDMFQLKSSVDQPQSKVAMHQDIEITKQFIQPGTGILVGELGRAVENTKEVKSPFKIKESENVTKYGTFRVANKTKNIPEKVFVSASGGVIVRNQYKPSKFEQDLTEGISSQARGLKKSVEYVFTSPGGEYRNPIVNLAVSNPFVIAKKGFREPEKIKDIQKASTPEIERAKKTVSDREVTNTFIGISTLPFIIASPVVEVTLGGVGVIAGFKNIAEGETGKGISEVFLGSLLLRGGYKSGDTALNIKTMFKEKSTIPNRNLPSKTISLLKEQVENIKNPQIPAKGSYELTELGMERTNRFEPEFKTRVSNKQTKFGALKGTIETPEIIVKDVLTENFGYREIAQKGSPDLKITRLINKDIGKTTEIITKNGKIISKETYGIEPGESMKEIEIKDPLTIQAREAVGGKKISRASLTGQDINIKTTEGQLRGSFTQAQSQTASIKKNLRDLQLTAKIGESIPQVSRINPEKNIIKLGENINIPFEKPKFGVDKKVTKYKLQFGEAGELKDVIKYTKFGGRGIISEQKAQPRFKSTTITQQRLKFRFTNQPEELPSLVTPEVQEQVKYGEQSASISKFIESEFPITPQETIQESNIIQIAKAPILEPPTKELSGKIETLNLLSKNKAPTESAIKLKLISVPINKQPNAVEYVEINRLDKNIQNNIRFSYPKLEFKPTVSRQEITTVSRQEITTARLLPKIELSAKQEQKINSISKTKLQTTPKTEITPKIDILNRQEIKTVPITKIEIKQQQITEQRQRLEQRTELKTLQRLTPGFEINIPRIQIPDIYIPRVPVIKQPSQEYKLNINQGFEVLVRKKGEFVRINPKALSEKDALDFGASVVDRTALASFKIRAVNENVREVASLQDKGSFSKLKPYLNLKQGVYIEKPIKRISTKGELREITYKGIEANKRYKNLLKVR